jgi:hypothetical protein
VFAGSGPGRAWLGVKPSGVCMGAPPFLPAMPRWRWVTLQ